MSTNFAVPVNNASTTLTANYTSGALGTAQSVISLANGAVFPALTGSQYYRVTICQVAYAYSPTATTNNYTIYKADTVSGNTIKLESVLESTTDRNYSIGDVVEIRVTAGTLSDIQGAVNTLEAGGGGGMAIGGTVTGGTANRILYEGASHVLADSANLTYDGSGVSISSSSTSESTLKVVNTGTPLSQYVLEVHAKDDNPYLAGFFNDTFSTTNPAFTYFGWSTGVFGVGTVGAGKDFYLYANGGTKVSIGITGNGNNPGRVVVNGGTTLGSAITANATFTVNALDDTVPTSITKAVASQTHDLEQWQNSSGTVLSGVGPAGHHYMVTQSSGGTPSGTPPAGSLVFDTSNFKLWAYTGSAWKSTTLV